MCPLLRGACPPNRSLPRERDRCFLDAAIVENFEHTILDRVEALTAPSRARLACLCLGTFGPQASGLLRYGRRSGTVTYGFILPAGPRTRRRSVPRPYISLFRCLAGSRRTVHAREHLFIADTPWTARRPHGFQTRVAGIWKTAASPSAIRSVPLCARTSLRPRARHRLASCLASVPVGHLGEPGDGVSRAPRRFDVFEFVGKLPAGYRAGRARLLGDGRPVKNPETIRPRRREVKPLCTRRDEQWTSR